MSLEFNDKNFEQEVLKSDKPVLVDFWATWCGGCVMMGPIIDEIAKEMGDKAKVGKVNVEQSPVITDKFGIMSIPALFIFMNGKVVKEFIGAQNKEILKKEIKNFL